MGYPNQQFKSSLCVTGIKEDASVQHGSENDDPNQGEPQQEEEDSEIVEMDTMTELSLTISSPPIGSSSASARYVGFTPMWPNIHQ